MPRVAERIQPVRVISDEMNRWATIQRNMIGSITAAACLGDEKLVEQFLELKQEAQRKYDDAVRRKLREMKEGA